MVLDREGAGALEKASDLRLLSWENGSPGRTRTYDKSVNSRLLYQLSYRGLALQERRLYAVD